jgi:phage protein D
LHDEHQFDLKEMERLYEHHIQTQLQLIDEQHLVEKYERGQREAAQQQLVLFKEARVKSEQQRKEAAAAAANALQTSSIVVQIDGQPTLLQLSDAAIQPQANTTAANVAATASLTDNTTELIVPGKRLYNRITFELNISIINKTVNIRKTYLLLV